MPPFCALCRINSDLQNSLIIPEFFYRLIYDAKPRRFRIVSAKPSEPETFAQKGLRARLLCRACEQKIGKWEHYSKVPLSMPKARRSSRKGIESCSKGFDYKTFRLFLLLFLG